jgi:hypothetical protein
VVVAALRVAVEQRRERELVDRAMVRAEQHAREIEAWVAERIEVAAELLGIPAEDATPDDVRRCKPAARAPAPVRSAAAAASPVIWPSSARTCSLAHPLGVKMFSYGRVKNDQRDAADLADLLRMGRLPEAWIAPPATRELRGWVRHRAKLVGLRSSLKNQVQAVLASVQVTMSDLFGPGGSLHATGPALFGSRSGLTGPWPQLSLTSASMSIAGSTNRPLVYLA